MNVLSDVSSMIVDFVRLIYSSYSVSSAHLCVRVRRFVGAAEGEQSPRPALCNRIETIRLRLKLLR